MVPEFSVCPPKTGLMEEKLRMNPKKLEPVYQFKITLWDTTPPVWRLIQVPSSYSFWDLHVAIQDAMGWTDSHLHMFRVRSMNKRKEVNIGIPDESFDDIEILAGFMSMISGIAGSTTFFLKEC
jgi:hypothetical protein